MNLQTRMCPHCDKYSISPKWEALERDLAAAREFIAAAFMVYPNLDLDIERIRKSSTNEDLSPERR